VTAQQGSAADKIILNINVTEQSTGDYGITAGYDTKSGILGELSLTERNFLGRGQYIKASIGASQTGKSFDFSFTEPYFMGLKMSAGIDAYHHITDESTDNVYGTTSTGAQLRFGLPVTRDLTASLFTGIDQTTIADKSGPKSKFFTNKEQLNKAWVGYSLTLDMLDDDKHPTEGLYATLSQQYDGLSYNFIKTEAKARYFMPLFPDAGLVGSIKGQAGIINTFGAKGINPVEAFNYGGSLVRGFQASGMGPRSSGQVVGYTAYAGASAEVEFPIPMLPETYGLHGAVWGDAAVIGGSGAPGYSIDANSVNQPLKSAVGASIIWDSPFGPLRGDVAYVISKATNDKTQVFALTLQTLL
jgi:outer membrane protein insertion porin family